MDVSSFLSQYGMLFVQGTVDSLVMTIISCAIAYVFGTVIGVLLVITAPNGLHPDIVFNSIVGWIVNIGRSIPFIILIVAIFPFTRSIVGTTLGVPGAIVPLTVSCAPFVARMVEQSLEEVDSSLIEASLSFGATTWAIVRMMISEAMPSLVRGVSITFISLFGFAAMAGVVGAGGLGTIAYQYGFVRYNAEVMIVAIVVCVVIVILFQTIGDTIALKIDHRKR